MPRSVTAAIMVIKFQAFKVIPSGTRRMIREVCSGCNDYRARYPFARQQKR